VLRHDGRDRVGLSRVGRLHLDPLGKQRPLGRVHRRGLDPGAADIDAEYLHVTALRSPLNPPGAAGPQRETNSMVCHRLPGLYPGSLDYGPSGDVFLHWVAGRRVFSPASPGAV
jgi:hypothetical protein